MSVETKARPSPLGKHHNRMSKCSSKNFFRTLHVEKPLRKGSKKRNELNTIYIKTFIRFYFQKVNYL
ncbi:hypothetical protein GCM10007342_14340 [Staphylococcus pragensis]|nr:hypothetical protein GCM10007342_14340 [Staphylococcus pragensis]